jgi:hypothetical protein
MITCLYHYGQKSLLFCSNTVFLELWTNIRIADLSEIVQ